MACNVPIVSTNVGDVKFNLNGINGCFICKFDAKDIAEKILKAVIFKKQTLGRKKIIKLKLTNDLLAKEVRKIYHSILKNN